MLLGLERRADWHYTKRLTIGLLTLVALNSMPCASQDYAPLTIPLKVEQLPGKDIYFNLGSPGIPGKSNEGNTSNAGFVVTPDGVVVFDALGTPSLGWALLQRDSQDH